MPASSSRDGGARRRAPGHRPLLPGLAAPRHRLELAPRAGAGRRPARRRRHRLALARPDDASSPACGRGGHGRPGHVHQGPPASPPVRSRRSRTERSDGHGRARRSPPRMPRCILLRFEGGAPRRRRHLARSAPAGRTRSNTRSTAPSRQSPWDSEQPDQLWLGHRGRPNEILLKDPASWSGRARRDRPAGRACRGLRRHVPRTVPSRLRGRRRRAALRPPRLRHVRRRPRRDARGEAIAASAREGRWVEVAREARASDAPIPSEALGEARVPDRPIPRHAAHRGGRLGRRGRLRGPRDRLLAASRPDRRRRYAGTSHIDVADLSADQARDIRAEIEAKGLAISGLGFYPNPLHPDPAHRAAVIGHLKRVIEAAEKMDVPLVNTFMGGDGAKNQDENWDGGPPGLARHRRVRQRPRPEDHARELPDVVLLRRVAGRPQHRHHAADVAPDPRAVGRHHRPQLRPVAPRSCR